MRNLRVSDVFLPQVKGKIGKLPKAVCLKVKIHKWFTFKVKDEVELSQWIGKLNAPIRYIPTKSLS